MMNVLRDLRDFFDLQSSRECSRLNKLKPELQDALKALSKYHSFLEEKAIIIEYFRIIDLNNDDQISPVELTKFLSTTKSGFLLRKLFTGDENENTIMSPEESCNQIFEKADIDGDKMLSMNEFIHLMMSNRQ